MSLLRARTLRTAISSLRIQCRGLHCTAARLAHQPDPLRILYCGSDNFSVTHLRALAEEQKRNPSLIESIEVLHPPAKRTGRGRVNLTEVPIGPVARELSLRTHAREGFENWDDCPPIDLVVAVSIGFFVPERIITRSTYGGINVHPSLLPDLAGPAPIPRALLARDPYTGVTVQTLDPAHFDKGTILAQEKVPITYPDPTTLRYPDNPEPVKPGQLLTDLTARLAQAGSKLLLNALRNHLYRPQNPAQPINPVPSPSKTAPRKALKVHREVDHKVDWPSTPRDELVHRNLVLGDVWCDDLWCMVRHGSVRMPADQHQRVVIHSITPGHMDEPGFAETEKEALFVGTRAEPTASGAGQGVWLRSGTVESKAKGRAVWGLRNMKKKSDKDTVEQVKKDGWWTL